MRKDKRRKNLAFRPAGEDPLHDKAICFLDQIGRGQSDFVASAVVYYAKMLSEGKVENDIAKQLNINKFRAKFLIAPTLPNEKAYATEDAKSNPAMQLKPQGQKRTSDVTSESSEDFGEHAIVNHEKPFNKIEQTKSPLPDEMLQSLLKGFKIR